MTGYSKVERDRYGFKKGSLSHQIAALMDSGLTDDEIVKKKYLRHTVHTTRYQMKKSMEKWPNGYPAAEVEAPPPNKSLTNQPKKKGGLSAERFPDRFDQFQFKKGSALSNIAQRIAGGETSAAIIASGVNKFQVYKAAGRVARGPANLPAPIVPKETALTANNPPSRKRSNGHDYIPIPHVEMVFHDGKGNEIPLFASPELVPYIIPKVMRKLGLG